MARLTDAQREDILADFHTGQYSNNQLGKKYNTSHTTINKIVKGLAPKNKDKVSTISAMRAELSEQSFKEVSAVETEIEKRTKHLIFFENSALQNQQYSNKAMKEKKDDLTALEAHSRITQRNKETVLGKDKTIDITNTNAQQTNVSIESISTAIANGLPD